MNFVRHLGIVLCVVLVAQSVSAARVIIASAVTPLSMQTIVDETKSGDTIDIYGCHRLHNLTITKPLTIWGHDGATIASDSAGNILCIAQTTGVTVRGLTFLNTPVSYMKEFAAIYVDKSTECVLSENTLTNNFFGIYLSESKSITISHNDLTGADRSMSQAGNGIHLWNSRDVTIDHNRVIGHRDGIYFEYVRGVDVHHNRSEQNLRYGIHFMFSDSCSYSHNEFIANAAGIAVMYTNNVMMNDNLFQDSWGASAYGLLLKDIKDSKVLRNRFVRNSVAFQLEGCDRIVIEGNTLVENGWAMRIMANCTNNTIVSNDFVGNSFQVATNSRLNYNTFDGNYWSVYSGYDLDKNGFGDVPFRPVSLYGLIVEQRPPSIILMRSLLVEVLNLAERLIPTITPETLVDNRPAMKRLT